MNIRLKTLWSVGAVLGLCVCSCSNNQQQIQPQPQTPEHFYQLPSQATAMPAKLVEFPDYRLNIGDMLEIIYHIKHLATDEYRFHTEDIITISFPYHKQFNQTITVQPDGRIRLLLVGEVNVFEQIRDPDDGQLERIGKTPNGLEKELTAKYSKYLNDPAITVGFKAANIKIDELKKAITTSPRGQSRLMPITPDGKITLPYIGEIRAYGKTIPELHKLLNDAYAQAGLAELEVTAQILSVAPRKIFVMGEVHRPGVINVDNMITLTHALTMAGGTTKRADNRKVLVVRRKGLPVPEGTLIDIEDMLYGTVNAQELSKADFTRFERDFWLDDYDLVFVPATDLARTNDWIEQVFTKGIYGVMPFSTSVGVNFGYQMYYSPQSVKTRNGSNASQIAGALLSR